jgi:hypothetical protein
MTEQHIEEQTDEDRISNETSDLESDLTDDLQETETPETEPVENDDDDDMFPRSYVEKLRDENAKYRQRAQRSDELAERLHTALVAATGRLHDPTDLQFNEEHLDDEASLEAAIDDLLERKPHLASRKVQGDIGQGATTATQSVDLAGLLRARA